MTNVYKIGVSIALSNGMSPVLGVIARDLLGIHGKVSQITGGFNRWKLAVGGALAIMGGAGLLGVMGKLVDKGAELVHQQNLMAVQGLTNKEIAQATAEAWRLSGKYQNLSVVDMMKLIGETRLPYGSTEMAIRMADPTAAFASVMRSTLGAEAGGDAAKQMFELVRGAEMRNLTLNPQKMTAFLDDAAKVVEAFHGMVKPSDMFQFLKYARTNAAYLSERFVTRIAPSLMLETGSSSAGTALTSLGQAIIGGKMTKRSAQELIRLGLIDPSAVLKTTTSSTQLRPGAVRGWQLAETDPDLWVQQYLMPAMARKGITDQQRQRLEFGVVFGNRTAEQVASIMGNPESVRRLNKDASLIDRATGLLGAKGMLGKDYFAAQEAAHQQFDNMLIAIGKPLVPVAVDIMKKVANLFSSIADIATKHPHAVEMVGKAVMVLGVALIGLGTGAVIAAIGALASAAGPVALAIAVGGALLGGVAAWMAVDYKGFLKTLKADFGPIGQILGAALDYWNKIDWHRTMSVMPKFLAMVGDFGKIAAAIAGSVTGLQKNPLETIGAIRGGIDSFKADYGAWRDAMDAPPQPRKPAVPPSSARSTVQPNGDVFLDGHKVGNVLSRHLGGVFGGTTGFDPSLDLMPVAGGYNQ